MLPRAPRVLCDFDHEAQGREQARGWNPPEGPSGWASCPITQNGFVRIASQPRYPSPIRPSEVIGLLARATATPHHAFWPCDVSLLDPARLDRTRIHGPRQLTDSYLLTLAVAHGGRLVTFDRTIPLSAVPAATAAHLVML